MNKFYFLKSDFDTEFNFQKKMKLFISLQILLNLEQFNLLFSRSW